ncbi:MAG: hypothetical protein IJX90_11220 [Blautia sp.]|nr:hypothetical protein [Blautia sp.]
MQVLYSSLHNLDLNQDEPVRKDIPSDFGSFMQSYIEFATSSNDTTREYTVRDKNRTVVSCLSDLFCDVLKQGDIVTDPVVPDSMSDSIALKLLDAEKSAQERVQGMSTIQKGSIVQALIKDDDTYSYVIAKVEHKEWFEGETLQKNFGFPNENKVWKSAVIGLSIVADAVMLSPIRCYINTQAKYWTESFLEVDEAKNDTTNTLAVMKAIDKVLGPLRNTAPIDYYNLRNSAIHELQTEQTLNYPGFVGGLLDCYCPTEESVDTATLKEKLLELPTEGKFDTQFHTDPKAIKNLKKVKISVSPTIDVLIREAQNNWEESFRIHEKSDGKSYLMIRCEDEKTLRMFPKDKD